MMTLLNKIERSFKKRKKPLEFIGSDELSKDEYNDLNEFIKIHPNDMTADDLEEHYEIIFWLSSEAFIYYLPFILCTGVKVEEPNLLINHSIIGMLDRSSDPSLWDDFFIKRWALLSNEEYDAVQEWILWLSSFDNTSYSESSLSRSFDILEVLKTVKPLLSLRGCP